MKKLQVIMLACVLMISGKAAYGMLQDSSVGVEQALSMRGQSRFACGVNVLLHCFGGVIIKTAAKKIIGEKYPLLSKSFFVAYSGFKVISKMREAMDTSENFTMQPYAQFYRDRNGVPCCDLYEMVKMHNKRIVLD